MAGGVTVGDAGPDYAGPLLDSRKSCRVETHRSSLSSRLNPERFPFPMG